MNESFHDGGEVWQAEQAAETTPDVVSPLPPPSSARAGLSAISGPSPRARFRLSASDSATRGLRNRGKSRAHAGSPAKIENLGILQRAMLSVALPPSPPVLTARYFYWLAINARRVFGKSTSDTSDERSTKRDFPNALARAITNS